MSAVSVESLDVSVIHFLPYLLIAYTLYHTTQWLAFAANWRCLCRWWFSTSWFAVGLYLDFWWWVSWRPWAMCFWATELVEPRVNQTWDFDTVWILRWVGPRPFASRGAVISCGYFCLVCLEPMEHNHYGCYACGLRDFFGLEELLFFSFLAICRE